MPFEPGHKRMGGRVKGLPNKKTQALKEIIEKCLGKSVPEAILDTLKDLESKDRAWVLAELMQYIYPKRKAIEVEDVTQEKSKVVFDIRWGDEEDAKALPAPNADKNSSTEALSGVTKKI